MGKRHNMKIQTKVIYIEDKPVLDVTMNDCEGFTINGWMSKGQAEAYLDELNTAVIKAKEFLGREQ